MTTESTFIWTEENFGMKPSESDWRNLEDFLETVDAVESYERGNVNGMDALFITFAPGFTEEEMGVALEGWTKF